MRQRSYPAPLCSPHPQLPPLKTPAQHDWPARRPPVFHCSPGDAVNPPAVPALLAAWQHSRETLARLTRRLQAAELPPPVAAIAVCGSLGRMEQRPDSDCDLIVLVDHPLDEHQQQTVRQAIQMATAGLFSRDTAADGFFGQPMQLPALLAPARRGLLNEDLPTFGTRMQLLLDSQPVLHAGRFAGILRQILDWYCHDQATTALVPFWHYLLQDLLRYHRALAIRYQWNHRDDPARWRVLRVKQLHGRLLNIAGLLLLLGEASHHAGQATVNPQGHPAPLDRLAHQLRQTPLERVLGTLQATGNRQHSAAILTAAEQLTIWLSDREWVRRLETGRGNSLPDSPELTAAIGHGRQLRSAIAGFLRDQHGTWPDDFLDSLIL